ncbi:MAG TPA: hypothetical protein VHU80_20500 [Polyangiaceae bacterium]|jgi:hypothetical protein|nr:hypothetical protein [Polyangiaceae bacterium]
MPIDEHAEVPGIGETWLADLGSDGPWGRFAVEMTFETRDRLRIRTTEGEQKGYTDSMPYTTSRVRPGLYVVRWKEPKTGTRVTQIEDWDEGTVVVSVATRNEFALMHGTFHKVNREG